ncbi:unnamed protein product [Colias eurytheme]|nr:unnamed protein product [Colias eurytheme]
MALPVSFQDPEDYFDECFEFFIEYEYLYNFPNTHLLITDTLNRIDIDGLEDIDIFARNFDPFKCQLNDYLNNLIQKLGRLRNESSKFEEDGNLDMYVEAPLGPKKKHEIMYLAKEIGAACKDVGCETVIDFGSGLGYLDQQIFITNNFNVLGLECNENHYVAAKKRQRQYYLNSVDHVKYLKHTVTEDSNVKIEECIRDKFSKRQNFCMTGLHACADLTVDAVNLFLKMEDARAIVIMPCCYHKILECRDGTFKNFPLSNCLKDVFDKYSGYKYLQKPFLRLAAQPPNIAEDNMEDLVFSLLARATLQVYASRHNCLLKRKKRKAVRLKSKHNDFDAYAEDAVDNGFFLIRNSQDEHDNTEPVFDPSELSKIWRHISEVTFKKTAIFIFLQNLMQPVFENFVLYDRLLYLKENGIEKCEIKRIVDECISPRCSALIAKK